jgi:UDPglucose--hexose-1-phosphate uridylyltransferase
MNTPHRRKNLLTGEWVLVSPHRGQRPWLGREERAPSSGGRALRHHADCYLCAGNTRAQGERNPQYRGTWVFDNDFPALLEDSATTTTSSGVFEEAPVSGTCRVLCFSPRHDLTFAELPAEGARAVVETWVEQVTELGERFDWVQVFENRGETMGCSNPHPHGQIWALDVVPTEGAKERRAQREWLARRGRPLLLDVMDAELAEGSRIVVENSAWVAWVPHWALWPFETLVAPRRPVRHLHELTPGETHSLAPLLQHLVRTYDRLFDVTFPYSMGWHGGPFDGAVDDGFQLHAHFFPPLLRSATVRKFMVGFELLSEGQRDLTPEDAAARLRASRQPTGLTLPSPPLALEPSWHNGHAPY